MMQARLDGVARPVSGRPQHERNQRQQGRDVARRQRCDSQHDGLLARLAVTPDEQGEAGHRQQSVQALPLDDAQARDAARAPGVGDDAR